ncbi:MULTISPECIES: hypothetical protein [unclassified Bradyrhizobium]|uniref:hypothetical protein n=1 Tax=unclassified Bradyrhizobium TaxID=2631580 RepID=UPI00291618FA|nr:MULTISPECIES: hypothetical protein [unclassified Bradyrhizobium]
MIQQTQHTNPHRIFRAAILNGVQPPANVVAILEARGENVGELEQRIRQSIGLPS